MDASVQNLARHARPWRELTARRTAFRDTAAILPLAAGVLAWALSLPLIQPYALGRYGLAPALPGAWYGALVLLVVGAVSTIWLGDRAVIAALYIAAIVAVLYATVPAVTSVPHYAWVYKHIGVTRLISDHGGVPFASGDIYSRWPAFFAGAAVFSNWAGVDPLAFAAW